MKETKLKPGQRVWFKGEADPGTGKMLCAWENGKDWFLATIAYELNCGVYCLRWGNGSPVGLPFSRRVLRLA